MNPLEIAAVLLALTLLLAVVFWLGQLVGRERGYEEGRQSALEEKAEQGVVALLAAARSRVQAQSAKVAEKTDDKAVESAPLDPKIYRRLSDE